ncbi:MAG: hypothetical protein QM779_03430 [Propionicimonas sp.]|uniref:hypothetical protein n=1 Tax=Propionicimonas sp. TaxID=1955623 RepID=UPI003D1523F1
MHAWVWVAIVVAIGAVVGGVLLWRRQRYLAQVKALGWSHDPRPTLDAVGDLHAPPFALGLDRSIDELVSGTTAGGFGFRVFEYGYTGEGPRFSARVAALDLPLGLPDAFVCGEGVDRVGIGLGGLEFVQAEDQGVRAVAGDGAYAADLLAAVGPAARTFGQTAGTIDLGVDGNHLVASGAPRDPERLAAFLAGLDPIAQAVAGSGALRSRQVAPAQGASYYGHPDWGWVGVDDGVLDHYPVTRDGYGHRTEDVVRGLRDGIRMDAFTHHWKTDRTVTETDSEGHTHTHTETDNHSEAVCGFQLPFVLPSISFNGGHVGPKVRFESSDFNAAFTVRTEDAKFASDVTHPRMMEWLLATRPGGWTVQAHVVTFDVRQHDLLLVDGCEATLRGWLGRIPRFVWQDLRVPVPPYLVE